MLIAIPASSVPPPSLSITISQPDASFNLVPNVAFMMIPRRHCRQCFTRQCTRALLLSYSQADVLLTTILAKAATNLGKERLPLICLAGRRAEVEDPRLGRAESRRLSGFNVCRNLETARRAGAFIISEVTGFSESKSGEKWTAAMSALRKAQPCLFFYLLPSTGLSLQQQEISLTCCHSTA